MNPPTDLVTGGTGLLGSHIAERLVARGRRVRCLVRPGADTGFLRSLDAELVAGDLLDEDSCHRATKGVENVYHAAAKVGDWGKWEEFRLGTLQTTENLARAASRHGVARFVHVSSTSAYGHPPEGGPSIDETAALGQDFWWLWDHYTRSKVECERLLWQLAGEGLPLTVIRPSWLYGERDRTTTARMVGQFRAGKVWRVGPGDNPMSAIYAGEVAEAAILAAHHAGSLGEAYNVTDLGPISQAGFLDLWAEAVGVPAVRRSLPYRLVFAAATALEAAYRLVGSRRPPRITRYAAWLMGRRLEYRSEKARTRLGWTPATDYRQSLRRTVDWFEGRSG